MPTAVRLRQVAVVARELEPVVSQLRKALGLAEPFQDAAVAALGVENAVLTVGDTFIEVLAPLRSDTTAGRRLERAGGGCGYMAIFQVPDLHTSRKLVAHAGARVTREVTYPDLVGRHLHPDDVPGGLMSLDWVDPVGSWRWAGRDWTAAVPPHAWGGLTGISVAVIDPPSAAATWGAVLGVAIDDHGGHPSLRLDCDRQVVRFVPCAPGAVEGIVEVGLLRSGPSVCGFDTNIGGVLFRMAQVNPCMGR